MKAPQISEQRHAEALEKAHADLRKRLSDWCRKGYTGLPDGYLISSASVYSETLGYFDTDEKFESRVDRFNDAVQKAWRREVMEKGERLNLGDALDRAIRDSTIAIGERWHEEIKVKAPQKPAKERPRLRRVA